jgi:putative ABC transport system substrate-binding protein
MDRRVLLGALAGTLLAAPVAAWAQPGKVVRIGFLSPASASDPRMLGLLDAFRRGLVELGYVEGRAFRIESRWAEGRYERLPRLAAELVASRVDVILTVAVPAIRVAREATRTIPIVMASVVDPVATGLVASLARPGGNITGLSNMAPDVTGKLLEILKQVVPPGWPFSGIRVTPATHPSSGPPRPQARRSGFGYSPWRRAPRTTWIRPSRRWPGSGRKPYSCSPT